MNDRARQLIEALGWEIKRDTPTYLAIDTRGNAYDLASGGWGDAPNHTYEQAAKAYDKLAEQAQRAWEVSWRADNDTAPIITTSLARDHHSRAAELRAMIPKEPTLLEKLEKARAFYTLGPIDALQTDALIDLLKRQGKE